MAHLQFKFSSTDSGPNACNFVDSETDQKKDSSNLLGVGDRDRLLLYEKSAERQGVISTIGDWQGCVFFGTKLLYQGGWGGWPTGNGKKVSKSQACGLAQLCLAAA